MPDRLNSSPPAPVAPRYLCKKCLALAKEAKRFYKFSKKIDEPKIECPICTLMYVYTEDFSIEMFGEYLSFVGCSIEMKDAGKQAGDLGAIARDLGDAEGFGPEEPSEVLSRAINRAQAFVHLFAHRINPAILGSLKKAALGVPVRVVLSKVDEDIAGEIDQLPGEGSMLTIKTLPPEAAGDVTPDRAIVVIDGLLAFTPAKDPPYREKKGGKGDVQDLVAITDVDRIISLHNRIFSPLWAKLSDVGEKIFMDPS